MFSGRESALATVLVAAAMMAGCAGGPPRGVSPQSPVEAPGTAASTAPPAAVQASYQVPVAVAPDRESGPGLNPPPGGDGNVEGSLNPRPQSLDGELSLDPLLVDVEARNPSLQAAMAAWNAAAQRYPQVVSLDDPMFETMIAPGGLARNADSGGWMVQASQRLPWPGKRALRGSAATAEADAMRGDLGDTRLKLAEMTRMAFYDYYLSARLAEVNDANRRLLGEFRQLARTEYEANRATQQDVLEADVELAAAESRATELARDYCVAAARINTLLHMPPDSPLPLPPRRLALPEGLPAAENLQATAVLARPDLQALYSRLQVEEANLTLAQKEYYPDVAVVAKYDAFWQGDLRPEIGMQMNVPLPNGRRGGGERGGGPRAAAALGVSKSSGRRALRRAICPRAHRAGAAGRRPLRGEDSAAEPAERGVGAGELH